MRRWNVPGISARIGSKSVRLPLVPSENWCRPTRWAILPKNYWTWLHPVNGGTHDNPALDACHRWNWALTISTVESWEKKRDRFIR